MMCAGTAGNSSEEIRLNTATAQLDKLRLEITKLETKPTRLERLMPFVSLLMPFISLLTVTITMLGFGWGIYVFKDQQDKDRSAKKTEQTIKLQNQVHSDINELLQFPVDQKQTVAHALFLLHDVDNSINSLFPEKEQNDENQKEKRKVSETIVELLLDCDLNDIKSVRFDIMVMDNWADYLTKLQTTPSDHYLIRYTDAIEVLCNRKKKMCGQIRFEQGSYTVEPKTQRDPDYDLFKNLVAGFRLHLDLLKDQKKRNEAIEWFRDATQNGLLVSDLFSK